jgi:excisionase family DNA binding protein
MTLEEVAAYLRCSPATVYRLLRKGELKAFKVGDFWRIRRVAFEAWMAEKLKVSKTAVPRAKK